MIHEIKKIKLIVKIDMMRFIARVFSITCGGEELIEVGLRDAWKSGSIEEQELKIFSGFKFNERR